VLLGQGAKVFAEGLVISTFEDSGIGLFTKPVLQAAYTNIGVSVEIVEYPSSRALKLSNSGKVDGEASRLSVIEGKFNNLLRIPTPVGVVSDAVFSLDPNLQIDGWESIKDFRVVTIRGFKNLMKKTEKMDRTTVANFNEALLFLAKGRADIAVLTAVDGLKVKKELKLDNVIMLKPFLATKPLYHYLHKKNVDLLPAISKSMADMEEAGEIKRYRDEAMDTLQ